MTVVAYQYNLYGVRKSLSNNYQYIALKIMVYFCNKYSSKLIFDKDKMSKYVITKEQDEFYIEYKTRYWSMQRKMMGSIL